MTDVTSYAVEAPPGEVGPPLVSEAAAHDWAASNRRGLPYVIRITADDKELARRRFDPRPT